MDRRTALSTWEGVPWASKGSWPACGMGCQLTSPAQSVAHCSRPLPPTHMQAHTRADGGTGAQRDPHTSAHIQEHVPQRPKRTTTFTHEHPPRDREADTQIHIHPHKWACTEKHTLGAQTHTQALAHARTQSLLATGLLAFSCMQGCCSHPPRGQRLPVAAQGTAYLDYGVND